MAKTRLYTREEVREKIATASVFSFDRGVRAMIDERQDPSQPVNDNPLYVTLVADMWKKLGLADE